MTGEEKMLAAALRDLCGWHVGMALRARGLGKGGTVVQIDGDGVMWVRNVDGEEYAWSIGSNCGLPALDSPANWGHWARGIGVKAGGATLEFGLDDPGGTPYAIVRVGDGPEYGGHPATALLAARCLLAEAHDYARCLPPSVLAWWKEHGQ